MRSFYQLKRGRVLCPDCSKKNQVEKYKLSLEYVKEQIAKTGCEYVSGEYQNSRSLLLIRCRCGKLFEKSWAKFQQGQDHCPDCGMKNLAESKRKYTPEDAKIILAEYGYTMIGEYTWAYEPVLCLCSRCHETYIILSQLLVGCSGCEVCKRIDQHGSGASNYKGGVSSIEDILRDAVNVWRKDIRDLYQTCPITGQSGIYAVVHHLYGFNKIRDEAFAFYGYSLDRKMQMKDVPEEDLQKIILYIQEHHDSSTGILISNDIHLQFHKEYGHGNNTPQQFNEFLTNHYNITLDQIQKKG